MAHAVVLPKMGMTMVEGTITEWFVNDGDAVGPADRLFAFETEKVDYEVEAESAGTIRTLAAVDDTVEAGAIVAYILADGEALPADAAPPTDVSGAAPKPVGVATPGPTAPTATPAAAPIVQAQRSPGAPIKASPVAKRLAAEHNLDLATITGSGPGGRIIKEDVEAALTAGPPTAGPTAAPAAALPPLQGELPYRGMRRTIGTRMFDSLQTTAQLTIAMDVDMTDVVKLRRDLVADVEPGGVRVTYTDLVIKAAALALRRHPRVNATLDGDTVRVQPGVHVGLAVALEEGLIVPVIRDADAKPIHALAAESAVLATKAREGGLGPDDLTGGTFTVTSLGMFDVDVFTPILNTPQAAILGVGRIADRPVFVGDSGTEIERRAFLTLSLTIDHRILDGAPGAQFLLTVRQMLEHPYQLVMAP